MPYVNPTKLQIIAKLKEFDRIGRAAFLKKYASGFGARSWWIKYEDRLYDMKAIWAAAHSPPRWAGGFNTSEPHLHLPLLGFDRISAAQAKSFIEGKMRRREATYFERRPALVREAKRLHGTTCMACAMNFGLTYGNIGEGYIECHHLFEMAENEERASTAEDVVVVCANCQWMLHAGGKLRTISELKKIMKAAKAKRLRA